MRKVYIAPEAQVIILAPSEVVATNTKWSDDNSSWKTGGLFWKQNSDIPDTPASGKSFWYDFGLDELK